MKVVAMKKQMMKKNIMFIRKRKNQEKKYCDDIDADYDDVNDDIDDYADDKEFSENDNDNNDNDEKRNKNKNKKVIQKQKQKPKTQNKKGISKSIKV